MKLRDRDITGHFIVAIHNLDTNTTVEFPYMSSNEDHRPGRVELNGKVVERGMPQTSSGTWSKIKSRPSALRRFAHYLKKFTEEDHYLFYRARVEVDVRGEFYSELNFRPKALIISPNVSLCDPELSMWTKDWIEPEPLMPDHFRYQYPWVFLPMLLRGEDNKCTPWHGVQKTRKIEDSLALMSHFTSLDSIIRNKRTKEERQQAFDDYRIDERKAIAKRVVSICSEQGLGVDDGTCQQWAADSSYLEGPEAMARYNALKHFTELRAIIEEGWQLNRVDDNADSEIDRVKQEEDAWTNINILCGRWNTPVMQCHKWAYDVANAWITAVHECEKFSKHEDDPDRTPPAWEYWHGGFSRASE